MPSKLPSYHGFTETPFVGLYFCLFERPNGMLFGVAPMSMGMPDLCPLEEYETVAGALRAFRKGEGLRKLVTRKTKIPPPTLLQKWKAEAYAVEGFDSLFVVKVLTAKGKLVGWCVAAPECVGSPGRKPGDWNYVALHSPKHCPAVYGGDTDDDAQSACEWEHACGFKGELEQSWSKDTIEGLDK